MGFIRKELIEFMDGLVELDSEENKAKAILVRTTGSISGMDTVMRSWYLRWR